MMDELVFTPAREWRKESEGVLFRLPSGRVARLRGVGFDLWVMQGKIMDSLTPLIADVMEGKKGVEALLPNKIEELQRYIEVLNSVCQCAFVEPRLVDSPTKDNEIGFYDLDMGDKEFVYQLLGIATRDLERFRDEQARHVDGVVSPEGHGTTGEPDLAGEGMGDPADGTGRVVDGDPV